jgi:hypothetical protein
MPNQLKNLLLNYFNNEELKRYECLLYDETLPNVKSCNISTKQALKIYSIRAESPASLSGKIKGFPELIQVLERLDKIENSKVSIYGVHICGLDLVIFTDFDATIILGVLHFSQ